MNEAPKRSLSSVRAAALLLLGACLAAGAACKTVPPSARSQSREAPAADVGGSAAGVAAPTGLLVRPVVSRSGLASALLSWDRVPTGEAVTVWRTDDGLTWHANGPGISETSRATDMPPGRVAIYRLTAERGGVTSRASDYALYAQTAVDLSPPRRASNGGPVHQGPFTVLFDIDPVANRTDEQSVLSTGGRNFLDCQTRPDGGYSFLANSGKGEYLSAEGWVKGRTVVMFTVAGPNSLVSYNGVDRQLAGKLSEIPLQGMAFNPMGGSWHFCKVLPFAATATERQCLTAWASYRLGTALQVGETRQVVAPPRPIIAVLRPSHDPKIDFGPDGRQWHVTVDGRPDGDGSVERPWDLSTALAGPPQVRPGDVIWLHGGDYVREPRPHWTDPLDFGYPVKLAGQPGAYIKVKPWRGERVTIDGGLDVQDPSQYTLLEGFRLTVGEPRPPDAVQGNPGRPLGGLTVHGADHDVYADLYLEQNTTGVSTWVGDHNALYYGCVITDNGAEFPGGKGWHGVYAQNIDDRAHPPSIKRFWDCISVRPYGLAFHAYGHGPLYGIDVRGCIFAGQATLVGSQPGGDDQITFEDNVSYNSPMEIGYHGQNGHVSASGNLATGPRALLRAMFQHITGDVGRVDSGLSKYCEVRVDALDLRRVNMALWGSGADHVQVDLSSVLKPGQSFEIRRAGDLWGPPVVKGVYAGPVTIAMGGVRSAAQEGGSQEPTPSKQFDAFVIFRD